MSEPPLLGDPAKYHGVGPVSGPRPVPPASLAPAHFVRFLNLYLQLLLTGPQAPWYNGYMQRTTTTNRLRLLSLDRLIEEGGAHPNIYRSRRRLINPTPRWKTVGNLVGAIPPDKAEEYEFRKCVHKMLNLIKEKK